MQSYRTVSIKEIAHIDIAAFRHWEGSKIASKIKIAFNTITKEHYGYYCSFDPDQIVICDEEKFTVFLLTFGN